MTEKEDMKKEIWERLREKGDIYLVAALVDGSCGYHSPKNAMSIVEDFKNGREKHGCERCLCCYGMDLIKMVHSDIMEFERLPEEKIKSLIEFCQKTINLNDVSSMMLSLEYPTICLF